MSTRAAMTAKPITHPGRRESLSMAPRYVVRTPDHGHSHAAGLWRLLAGWTLCPIRRGPAGSSTSTEGRVTHWAGAEIEIQPRYLDWRNPR